MTIRLPHAAEVVIQIEQRLGHRREGAKLQRHLRQGRVGVNQIVHNMTFRPGPSEPDLRARRRRFVSRRQTFHDRQAAVEVADLIGIATSYRAGQSHTRSASAASSRDNSAMSLGFRGIPPLGSIIERPRVWGRS